MVNSSAHNEKNARFTATVQNGQRSVLKILAFMDENEPGRTGRPGLPGWLHELVVHPNHIVLYRVPAEIRTVQILRVKHAAQQVP